MYFPYFITYMVVGFIISLAVFFWALRNGQFKDQQRARFLPLEDEHETPIAKISTFKRYEAYALVLLSLAGLAASGAVLLFALLNANKF
ncbi:MAG: cbb3-type cytochrome oxidase assembly protein [Deltaproteobacteria bacterium]|nr:cbb3-type cytochrome oxidase assembly protein [Deltaproteobacteria bacterium]